MKDRIKKKLFLFLLFPVLICILTACSQSLVQREQPIRDSSILVSQQQSIGQTFTSEYNGLSGIIIYIDKINNGGGGITLHLRKSPMEATDLRTSELNLQETTIPGYYSFKFPPLTDSSHTDYYFLLDLQGTGSFTIGTTNQDNYLDGVLYQNNLAQNGQVNFLLIHNEVYLFTSLLKEVVIWLGWLLICFLLFVIPGWAIISIAWPLFGKLNWLEKLGLSAGVSLAVYPVLMLLADRINLKMGSFFAWLPMVLGIIILIWQNRTIFPQLLSRLSKKHKLDPSIHTKRSVPWTGISLLVLILLIFFVRFWAIRTIDVPMWGDSVQHTVIAQLILDNKGLFNNWEPYAPYRSMTVQYGFSAHTALFAWITGLPSYTAALIIGQIINGLAILTLIPLAYRLSPRNSWAAAATLIFAGLLSPMPAFYVNWGRYAQLDGQAILPVAIWLTCEFLENDRVSTQNLKINQDTLETVSRNDSKEVIRYSLQYYWKPTLVIAVVLVGMILSYYRMAFFYVCFLLAWIIYLLVSRRYKKIRQWIPVLFGIVLIGGTSLILFIPWLLRVARSSLSNTVIDSMINNSQFASVIGELMSWSQLKTYVPYGIVIVVVIACLWGIIRKRWDILVLLLWVGLIQLYFLGQLFRLPGATMLQVFAILIWLYMPATLIAGWFIGEIGAKLTLPVFNLQRLALALSLIILALYGANRTRLISNPNSSNMVTRPDLRAMAWIEHNTQSNAKFLVGAFRYNEVSAIGSDAGWWIPLLSQRQNTMPPQYALVFEVPETPNLTQRIVNMVFALETVPPDSPEGLQLLCKNKITHIYIGQNQVIFGLKAHQLYSSENLTNSPVFNLVYHQDRVYIFAFDRTHCKSFH